MRLALPPMTDDGDDARDRATLGGLTGRGYGVVESLPSLGKGRQLTGVFRTDAAHLAHLREQRAAGRRLAFDGALHFRHHSVRTAVEVELARVDEEGGQALVEFAAWNIPYSLG
jgi:hypothetical protein